MGIVSVEKDDAIYFAERLGGVIIISMLSMQPSPLSL